MFAARQVNTTYRASMRSIQYCFYIFLVLLVTLISTPLEGLTRLTKNDPYPLYTTAQPFDFLTLCKRNELKEIYGTPATIICHEPCSLTARIAFSPFRQNADMGQNIFEVDSELGDLTGRWNLLGLFYDHDKRRVLINGLRLDVAPTFTVCDVTFISDLSSSTCSTGDSFNYITDPIETDTKFEFGFLSVPITYRKYGVRFQSDMVIGGNYTLTVKGGIANIYQQPDFIDLTCSATGLTCPVRDCNQSQDGGAPCNDCCCPPVDPTAAADTSTPSSTCYNRNCCVDWVPCGCKSFVIDRITKQKRRVAELLGVDIDEFRTTGFEDIEVDINWVKMCMYNQNSCTWPMFILTPFVSFGFTIPSAKEICHSKLFALPLGNDGHWSYGIESGVDFDFAETIAFGASAGFTGFLPKNHKHFPVPTNPLQSGIYPELVTMRVQPGLNWDFSLYMNAYHFLDRLSAFVQYAVVGHDKDEFNVLSCQDPLEPVDICTLRDRSAWRFHMINGSLNYDIAPCITLGALWQIPIWQQNAYRSTTIVLSLQATY